MPLPDPSLSWWMTLAALGVITTAAFLVSWLCTEVLHLPRAVYLATLMILTGVLAYGYLAWSGTDGIAFISAHWGWGVLGAALSGLAGFAAVLAGARRRGLPAPPRRRPVRAVGEMIWEGLLYGAAEGMLLSVLPVLAAWQTFALLGWTDTAFGAIGSGILAIVASAFVIWIHHLGYREFRGTPEIALPILGCGVLSVAYLLTRSPIAAMGGHILLHTGMEIRGVPMPPYSKRGLEDPEAAQPRLRLAA